MTERPEALRLAEWLEGSDKATDELAAAELRRLYQLAQEQHTEIYGLRLQVRNLLDDYHGVLDTLEEMQAAVAAERERLTVAAECFRVCKHKGVCDEKATSNEAN
jgi:hypothetical protein